MDLMWMLISFGLFMLVILTTFISSVLNALFRKLHPVVHIVLIPLLSYVYTNIFFDENMLSLVTVIVTISYFAPLFVIKLYNKGERIEHERLQ